VSAVSDPETRDKIAELLRNECPIVAICQTIGRPPVCKYLGPTNDCSTCFYPWGLIADDTIQLIRVRRVALEREVAARRRLEKSLDKVMLMIIGDDLLRNMVLEHIRTSEATGAADKEMERIEAQGGGQAE